MKTLYTLVFITILSSSVGSLFAQSILTASSSTATSTKKTPAECSQEVLDKRDIALSKARANYNDGIKEALEARKVSLEQTSLLDDDSQTTAKKEASSLYKTTQTTLQKKYSIARKTVWDTFEKDLKTCRKEDVDKDSFFERLLNSFNSL